MDLRLTAKAPATGEERAAVDEVLGPPPSQWEGGARRAEDAHQAFGGHAARGRRHHLITVLHAIQEQVGWISPGALDYVSERLTVPPAEAYGVASFYAMFRTAPPTTGPSPGAVVHICDDVACKVAGAEALCAEMTQRFGPEGTVLESTGAALDGTGVTWQRSPCLGKCDLGSAALIQPAPRSTSMSIRRRLSAARARSSSSSTPTCRSTSRLVGAWVTRSWRPASRVLNQVSPPGDPSLAAAAARPNSA